MKGMEKARARARQIKTDVPALLLALRKRETPWYAKALAAVIVGYALSPVDLVPDFIPVLGYLDDLLLLPALIALDIRLIPADVLEQCREEARARWTQGLPRKWYYGVPIILLWALLIYWLVRAIF